MSRTKHSPNSRGAEWWSRRCISMITKGTRWTKWWKRATHKRERLEARDQVQRELADA